MDEYFPDPPQNPADWEASIQQQVEYIEWIKQKMYETLAIKLEPNNSGVGSL